MEYEIRRSGRKSIAIQITKEARILVRAPYHADTQTIEALLLKHKDWILKNVDKTKEKLENTPSLTDEQIRTLKKEARVYFTELTKRYSDIMAIKYGRITITSALTRFGSCSSKGNISYSYRLMLYPERAREYVVVHELCHILEMNHSKRFYALIEKVLPDYKERKRLLK